MVLVHVDGCRNEQTLAWLTGSTGPGIDSCTVAAGHTFVTIDDVSTLYTSCKRVFEAARVLFSAAAYTCPVRVP